MEPVVDSSPMLTVTFPAGTSTRQGGPAAPLGRPAMTDTHSRAVISTLQPSASAPPPATFTSVDSDVTRQAAVPSQEELASTLAHEATTLATSRSSPLSSDPTSPVATAVTVAAAAAAAVMAARGNIDEVNGSYPQQEAGTPLHAIEQQLLVRARARAHTCSRWRRTNPNCTRRSSSKSSISYDRNCATG